MNRRLLIVFVLIGLALVSWLKTSAQVQISNYKPYFASALYKGKSGLLLRKFVMQGCSKVLFLDPNNLTTLTPNLSDVKIVHTYDNIVNLLNDKSASAYVTAINDVRQNKLVNESAGLDHGHSDMKGIVLTVDLCPSSKPLDRIIFLSLIETFKNILQPVPVSIALTGRFLLTHSNDLLWLKHKTASGNIAITWINHSYRHPNYSKALSKTGNLFDTLADLQNEILETEQLMIKNSLTPSVFFRFPGLLSNSRMVECVTKLGLIPLGSNAWLAKNQVPTSGSIVLIHGNGNSPIGVKCFLQLLESKHKSVLKKEWSIFEVREAIVHRFRYPPDPLKK